MLLAQAYDESGRPAEAIDLVEQVVEDQPTQLQTRAWLGELYEKSADGRTPRRRGRISRRAVRGTRRPTGCGRRPRSSTPATSKADARSSSRSRRLTPRDISLWYMLSQVERRTGNARGRGGRRASRSRRSIRTTRAGRWRSPESQAARGRLRGRGRDAPAARHRGDRCRRDVRDCTAGWSATWRPRCSRPAIAPARCRCSKTARKRVPDDTDLQFELASAYDRAGQLDQAETILRSVIGKDPANAQALNYLGYMLADHSRKLPEALDLIQRALKIDTDNPSYLDSLGWTYFKLEKLAGRADAARARGHRAAARVRHSGSSRPALLPVEAVPRGGHGVRPGVVRRSRGARRHGRHQAARSGAGAGGEVVAGGAPTFRWPRFLPGAGLADPLRVRAAPVRAAGRPRRAIS